MQYQIKRDQRIGKICLITVIYKNDPSKKTRRIDNSTNTENNSPIKLANNKFYE